MAVSGSMKVYLAARYSRREELCEYRRQLEDLGYTVTSRWLNGKHQVSDNGQPIGDHGEALVEADRDGSAEVAAHLRASFANDDVEDVMSARCLVAFTEPPRSSASRGGRHVELGIGLANGMRVIVVGHRENIFCWLPEVEFYETWESVLDAMEGARQ